MNPQISKFHDPLPCCNLQSFAENKSIHHATLQYSAGFMMDDMYVYIYIHVQEALLRRNNNQSSENNHVPCV